MTDRHTGWFKSSFSANNSSCVEARFAGPRVQLRDSKRRTAGPILEFDRTAWTAFLTELGR
ncbi:DUF397 domain-containing protein [Amycolatopsis aidingensis]|uniref:DUF397 domain-containing protein n=1 Tax=Amycolatopsis aidingensis TaxID=2842453 RepID=UPI001C0AB121|nr:DUF397 domain-containing protein [Amycolatopsis aidingensis]